MKVSVTVMSHIIYYKRLESVRFRENGVKDKTVFTENTEKN